MKNSVIALIQGLVLVSIFLKRIGIIQGEFAFPALTIDSFLDVYAPGIVGMFVLVDRWKLPSEQLIATILLLVIAFRVLVTQARTDFSNFDNIWEGLAPAAAGGLGALKVLKAA